MPEHLSPFEKDIFDNLEEDSPPREEMTERRRKELIESIYAQIHMVEAGALVLQSRGRIKHL